MKTIKGPFEVKMTPLPFENVDGDPKLLQRLHIDKRYQGALEGVGTGQMMAAQTSTEGSAGYVAIEHVAATLEGRSGTFVLQHSGVMNRAAATLSVTVVPDSGTGDLEGLSGSMDIVQDDGHAYVFSYVLP